MPSKPAISLVCPSFNHERFVGHFIRSVLAQDVEDFELIIIDDCSSDGNVAEISKFADPRIRLVRNAYNRGINYGFSEACRLARADVIAWIASDDMCLPGYFRTVLGEFERGGVDVLYAPLQYINVDNQPIPHEAPLPTGLSADEIFARTFLDVNPLPSPGMAFRKSAVMPFLPLDYGLLQCGDWQLNLFLTYHCRIRILGRPIVAYRLSEGSACARRPDVVFREELEIHKLMDTAVRLIGDDVGRFVRIFGGHELIRNQVIDAESIAYWLGRLALTSRIREKRRWGHRAVMDFIAAGARMELLHARYGFSFAEYVGLAAVALRAGGRHGGGGAADADPTYADYEKRLARYGRRIRRLRFLLFGLGAVVCALLVRWWLEVGL